MKKYKLGNFIPIITMFIVFILGSVFNLKGLFIIGLQWRNRSNYRWIVIG